jgi:hypothetical protein
VTGYGLDGPSSILGKSRFSLLRRVQQASYSVGIGGGRAAGRQADHSFPSTVQVSNTEATHPLLRTYSCGAAELIKRRDKFTSTLPPPPTY